MRGYIYYILALCWDIRMYIFLVYISSNEQVKNITIFHEDEKKKHILYRMVSIFS